VALVAALLVVGAYLLGTFPTALLVGRRAGFDPTTAGSGNPGASNTYRLGGRRAGAIVLAGDLLKGVVAAALGLVVSGRPLGYAMGIAAVLGHIAPATRRFQGGKGVATAAGMAAVLLPVETAAAVGVFGLVAAATRTPAIASIAAMAGLLVAVVASGRPASEVAAVAVVAVLITLRHRGNLSRLRRGQELPIGDQQRGTTTP
jgi:glycerol-3-phosphate acyltransferase PlsY